MSVLSRKSLSCLLMLAGLGLAGCAHDDLALDDAYAPLSPEERFPIPMCGSGLRDYILSEWS